MSSSKKPPTVASKPCSGAGAGAASGHVEPRPRAAPPDRPHTVPERPPTWTSLIDRRQTDTSRPTTDRRPISNVSDRPSVPPPLPDKPTVMDKPTVSTDRTTRDSPALNCGQQESTERQTRDEGIVRQALQRASCDVDRHHQQQQQQQIHQEMRRGSTDTAAGRQMKPTVPPPPASRTRHTDT